jgi:ATP-dependent Lhr-like helicase
VNSFDTLHPALQYHIVNSLGWSELRPFQEAALPHLLAGKHAIVLAPTAGGKTEAVCFPLFSRMLSDSWEPLSILYLCPIKALLNNLAPRLEHYLTLLGRRSALWHGDVSASKRKAIKREPPDLLLTTPESLEVILTSTTVDCYEFLANVQAVVVDEVHAFAGDDRGWHLLALLARVMRIAGREFQRVGLSATVGNPEDLLDWLTGGCQGPKEVLVPQASASEAPDVMADYVGSLENAAHVISRLHRGEKRLVFVDSRARAEKLGANLRQVGVDTYVTHSSLSREQRATAETAFNTKRDCVVVATSVLELGVDIGDLDRVIQIDSPPTVSAFLQRMGRTGRRRGSSRNCLFLATGEQQLLHTIGQLRLWESGYVEPVDPPLLPYHILAQQLMALALQEKGIPAHAWFDWVKEVPAFAAMPPDKVEQIKAFMLEQDILFDDNGILWFGRAGEEKFGRKHFLELLSVFTSSPIFAVLYGRTEIGYVDEQMLTARDPEEPWILLLGGRSWSMKHVEWRGRKIFVEPADSHGKAWWQGAGRGVSKTVAGAIRHVLQGQYPKALCSKRAVQRLESLTADFTWMDDTTDATWLVHRKDCATWWNFAGTAANTILAYELKGTLGERTRAEALSIAFPPKLASSRIEKAILEILARPGYELRSPLDPNASSGLKFSEALPTELSSRLIHERALKTADLACTASTIHHVKLT